MATLITPGAAVKLIAAAGILFGAAVGMVNYVASADVVNELADKMDARMDQQEKDLADHKVMAELNELDFDIELAETKKASGRSDQQPLIDLLKKKRLKILEEEELKLDSE